MQRFAAVQAYRNRSSGSILAPNGISQATYFNWKKKYAGLMPSEMKKLRELEDENRRLKKEDGRVAMDNNAAERGMRPIGVGRRNWLFAGADTGGETLARAMTLIETAKMSGIDPQAWLTDVLNRIHDHKNKSLHELLPWNWAAGHTSSASQAN